MQYHIPVTEGMDVPLGTGTYILLVTFLFVGICGPLVFRLTGSLIASADPNYPPDAEYIVRVRWVRRVVAALTLTAMIVLTGLLLRDWWRSLPGEPNAEMSKKQIARALPEPYEPMYTAHPQRIMVSDSQGDQCLFAIIEAVTGADDTPGRLIIEPVDSCDDAFDFSHLPTAPKP